MLVVLYFCFFFLLIRRPPRSTLFPYTTLFRSLKVPAKEIVGFAFKELGQMVTINQRLDFDMIELIASAFGFQDRKSTRLNSSHTVISYAVFCLKKKKKKYS